MTPPRRQPGFSGLRPIAHCLVLLATVGCHPESQIREYEVASDETVALPTDALRGQYESLPFDWTVPDSWSQTQNDQFSKFAWKAGPSGAEARITVSDLPAGAGIEPQFIRWQGQLQLPESATADSLKSVEEVTVEGATGRWIELRGESETILGMIVPLQDKLWVFKYRSANSTAATQRSEFRAFCESLKAG